MKTEVRNVQLAAELLKQVMAEFDDAYKNFQTNQQQGQVTKEQLDKDINQLKKIMNVMSYLQSEIKSQLKYIDEHPDPAVSGDKSFFVARKDIEENLFGNVENLRSIEKRKVDLRKDNIEIELVRITPTADRARNEHLTAQMLENVFSQFTNFKQLQLFDAFLLKAEELHILDKNTIPIIKEANKHIVQSLANDIDIATKMHITEAPPIEVALNLRDFKFKNDINDPNAPFARVAKNFDNISQLSQAFILGSQDTNEVALRIEQIIMVATQLLQKGDFEAFLAVSVGIISPPIDKIIDKVKLSNNAQDMLKIIGFYAEPLGNYADIIRLQNDARNAGVPYIPCISKFLSIIDKFNEVLPRDKLEELNKAQADLQSKKDSLANFSDNESARLNLIKEIKADQKKITGLVAEIGLVVNISLAGIKEYNNLRAKTIVELKSANEKSALYDLTNMNVDPNRSESLYKAKERIVPRGGQVKQSTLISALGGLVSAPEATPFIKKSGLNDLPKQVKKIAKEIEIKEAKNMALNAAKKKENRSNTVSGATIPIKPATMSSLTGEGTGVDKGKERATIQPVMPVASDKNKSDAVASPVSISVEKSQATHVEIPTTSVPLAPQQSSDSKIQAGITAPPRLAEVLSPINLSQTNQRKLGETVAPIESNVSTPGIIKPERSELLHDLSNRFNELHKNIMDKREATPERLANIEEARQIINEIKKIMHELSDKQYKELENEVRSAAEKSIETFQATVSNMVVTLKIELAQKLHELAQIRFVGIDNDGKRKEQLENARAKVVKINSDIDNILKLDVDNPHVKHYIDDYRKLISEYDKFLMRNQTRELTRYDEAKIIFKSMMDKAIEMNNILIDIVQAPTPEISEKARRAKELLSEIKRDKSNLPNVLQGASEVVVKISDLNLKRINEIQVPQFTATSKEPVWQTMPSTQDTRSLSNLTSASAQTAPPVLSSPSIAAQNGDLRGSSVEGFYQPMPPTGDNSSARSTSAPEQTGPSVNESPMTKSKELPKVTEAKPPVGNVSRLNKFFGDLFHFNVVPKKDSNQIMGAMLGGKIQEVKSTSELKTGDLGTQAVSEMSKDRPKERPMSRIELEAARGRERREQEAQRMQKGKGHAPK